MTIRTARRAIPAALLLACAGIPAGAHNHVTVDTPSGLAGQPALADVGYLPAESANALDTDGRLLRNGAPMVYSLTTQVASGPFAGWYTADLDLLTLTSDFHYVSGRLGLGFSFTTFTYAQPGDFAFEIVSVEPVCGSLGARYAHRAGQNPAAIGPSADTEASSFFVGAGEHQHGQRMLISQPGVYDITLRVRDRSSLFTTAPPGAGGDVVFTVTTGHAGPADLAAPVGTLNFSDVSAFLAFFNAGDAAADLAAPAGVLNFFDVTAFIRAFSSGCP